VEYPARWRELREIARTAEAVGLDSIWVGDHYLYRDERGTRGPWECWTQLAALAEATERITLGPLVAATAFHNPVVLAKLATTVEEVSGGRLVLGLGAGWNEVEFRALGLPFDHRVDRFEEAFTIIRTLLRDGRIDFDGRHYSARESELIPRGPRPGGPPLLIGSNGARMLRIAVPHVQSWNSWFTGFGNRPEGIAPLRSQVDEACRDVGRDPATLERTVAVLMVLEGAMGARVPNPAAPPLSGPPEQLADSLRAFAAEGIAHVQLVIDPITPRGVEQLGPIVERLDHAG
jgi:alkanesulfonate monooxygenase SsuD/methylene tetrahydromethanopterin reductase-like flavin-dependent oxidoreductase (luciferase family)